MRKCLSLLVAISLPVVYYSEPISFKDVVLIPQYTVSVVQVSATEIRVDITRK
ncbi:MAG: hypothetical protein IJ683_07515 [Butyrivibrio sp.]|nr:hypothetical protein [Butyrivibrio sp.]MBR1642153.1 hypothetical protein [Butyrivibrio sp.]